MVSDSDDESDAVAIIVSVLDKGSSFHVPRPPGPGPSAWRRRGIVTSACYLDPALATIDTADILNGGRKKGWMDGWYTKWLAPEYSVLGPMIVSHIIYPKIFQQASKLIPQNRKSTKNNSSSYRSRRVVVQFTPNNVRTRIHSPRSKSAPWIYLTPRLELFFFNQHGTRGVINVNLPSGSPIVAGTRTSRKKRSEKRYR
ncbi:hypothetical protein K438DRAFT_1775865 [Mycena galopus ATCC 62051]|nr:hypothetical protein K438DRAFT_1775865 [Mycena galopus ATCC 62051]